MRLLPCNEQRGFTLTEVLIALAILAIAMGALIKGGGQSAATMEHLRNKTLASWVAHNSVSQIQLEKVWPLPSQRKGREEMAGISWSWEASIEDTFDVNVKRIYVRVKPDDSSANPVATVTAFVAKP